MNKRMNLLLMSPLIALAFAACATTTVVEPAPDPADAEILAIAMAANQGEIQESEIARTSATSQAVRDFAAMMVQHHTAALDQERNWSTSEGVSSMANDSSRALASNSAQSVSALRQYSGAALDRVYMQRQVALHRYVLNGIDSVLLPRANDVELRAHLEQMRATVQSHLTQAERIVAGLPR